MSCHFLKTVDCSSQFSLDAVTIYDWGSVKKKYLTIFANKDFPDQCTVLLDFPYKHSGAGCSKHR